MITTILKMRKEEWISRYLPRLLVFIGRRSESEEDAWDILQETLISASESLPTFSGHSRFFSWLCGIAKHEISDFYRKKKIKTLLFSHFPFLENLADQALGPEEEMMEAELQKKVKRILLKMTEGYQIILRLKYIEGHSVAQIAQKLGLTLKAVESRLTRARFAFREAWNTENAKSPITPSARAQGEGNHQSQEPKEKIFF